MPGRSWVGPWRSPGDGRPGRSTSTSGSASRSFRRRALGPIDAIDEADGDLRASTPRPFTDVVGGRAELSASDVAGLADRLTSVARGLILAGPQDDPGLPAALARLAAATGYPILADPLSLVRCGPHDRSHVVSHGDHLVRPGAWRDAHLPELVIRFGATPTSKPVLTMLTDAEPIQIVVDGDGGWSDPAILPTTFVHADGVTAACALADSLEGARADGRAASGAWASSWLDADRAADAALTTWLAAVEARDEPFEGLPFAALGTSLPDGALLWAGNSMPVRDLDDWLPGSERAIRPLSEPRRERDRRRRVDRARGGGGRCRAGRRSSSATCRSCTT